MRASNRIVRSAICAVCATFAQSILIALVMASAACAQNTYKWVDEKGRVTYSDQPPVGNVKSKEVISIPGAASPAAVKQMNDQNAQFRKRQEDAAKAQATAAKKEEVDKQKAENCSRARGELRALRDNAPVMKLTESGERILLDAGARDAEMRRMETYLEENCTQPG